MSPTEEEWTTHEETIRRLYYESTRVRLMAHMEQQYGFTARYVTLNFLISAVNSCPMVL